MNSGGVILVLTRTENGDLQWSMVQAPISVGDLQRAIGVLDQAVRNYPVDMRVQDQDVASPEEGNDEE